LVRFEFIEEAMNTDLLIGFMERLISDSSQKVFLILDNLKVHHAKLVTAWLAERKDQIEVFYLPPYSPEINPDEYLHRDFKTGLRFSDRADSKKGLLHKACAFMERLLKTPERVTRVRQLNAQVFDCYEREFKSVYYNRGSCCGGAGFFRFSAANTRLWVSDRREIPLMGLAEGLIRI
jgi:transposase